MSLLSDVEILECEESEKESSCIDRYICLRMYIYAYDYMCVYVYMNIFQHDYMLCIHKYIYTYMKYMYIYILSSLSDVEILEFEELENEIER